jgi:hypothetical protein
MQIPEDTFFLFQKLEPEHWPDLHQLGYSYLDRDTEHAGVLLKVLRSLPSNEGAKAFLGIRYVTQREILRRLTPESRTGVLSAVTAILETQWNEFRRNPQEEAGFTATESFIDLLPKALQTCSGRNCIGRSRRFQGCSPFLIGACLSHAYHPACTFLDDECAGTNQKATTETGNEDRDRVATVG